MAAVLEDDFGNPSSVHAYGRMAKTRVEDARDPVDVRAELAAAHWQADHFEKSAGATRSELATSSLAEYDSIRCESTA